LRPAWGLPWWGAIEGNHEVTRPHWAKWRAKRNGYRISGGIWEQNEISDLNARIAPGAGTGKGVESAGSNVDSHERSTDGVGEDTGW
jgi:hypothetical protein